MGWTGAQPAAPAPGPGGGNSAAARHLVLRYGHNTMAYQILNPGIAHWFAPGGDAVVGYVAAQGYRVVAGAPICATERLAAVAAAFEAATDQAGQRVCYFGAQDDLLLLLDSTRPLAGLLLGAQPVWRPQHWRQRLAGKASLRAQLARARNKQVTVRAWPAAYATDHPGLWQCLGEWLDHRHLPPLHFLVEPATLGHLADRLLLVAERQGQIVGFLVASPIPRRNGWLIEQIIRRSQAPNGTTELLLDGAMHHLAAVGADYVTLGLAPLSRRAGITQTPQPPLIRTLLDMLRQYGQHFYNFDGLDAYKAKFLPEWWEPVYLLAREPHISLRTLYALVGAFSRTEPASFIGRGLIWALRQRIQRYHQRFVQTLAHA